MQFKILVSNMEQAPEVAERFWLVFFTKVLVRYCGSQTSRSPSVESIALARCLYDADIAIESRVKAIAVYMQNSENASRSLYEIIQAFCDETQTAGILETSKKFTSVREAESQLRSLLEPFKSRLSTAKPSSDTVELRNTPRPGAKN